MKKLTRKVLALTALTLLIGWNIPEDVQARRGGGHRGGHRGGRHRGGMRGMHGGRRGMRGGYGAMGGNYLWGGGGYAQMGRGGGHGRRSGGGHARRGGGGYGQMGGGNLYGSGWSGWARPQHRFSSYGWGGWQQPYYGGYGGYGSSSFGMSSVDAGGSLYTPSSYGYMPATITGSTWTSGTVSAVPLKSIEPKDPKEKITYKSIYRLGPDADIVADGKIAFHLTKNAYLLASNNKIVAVEQSSGYPTMSLYPDKVLTWHLSLELEQQILGLKSTIKRKGALVNSPVIKSSKEKTITLNTELANLDKTIGLLEKAKSNLGTIPKSAPDPEKPPEKGAMEIFASTWMLEDGNFIVIRIDDGSYIYIDRLGTYKDSKKTPLKKAYPGKFERIVFTYLKKLIKESKTTTKNLKDDNDNTHWALEQLKAELEEEYNKTNKDKKGNATEITESQRRMNQAIVRSEHKFAATTNQIVTMPGEVAAAKKLINSLSK